MSPFYCTKTYEFKTSIDFSPLSVLQRNYRLTLQTLFDKPHFLCREKFIMQKNMNRISNNKMMNGI